jgi:hypothetical protein
MIKSVLTALSFVLTMSWCAFPATAQYSSGYAQETDRTDRQRIDDNRQSLEDERRRAEDALYYAYGLANPSWWLGMS